MGELNDFYSLLRRIYIIWQAQRWSRIAQRAIRNLNYSGAEIALAQFAKLNEML